MDETPTIRKRSVLGNGKARGRVIAVIHHVKPADVGRQYSALVAELAAAGLWQRPVELLRKRAAALAEAGSPAAVHVAHAADHLEKYGRLAAVEPAR